jgi:hypothetical protein
MFVRNYRRPVMQELVQDNLQQYQTQGSNFN